ncbi:aminotransferase class I/II-fold pyridoxal phosphate-dependent enzyme [Rhodococcus rhodnii]|uniref:Transcriptional regulator n=2 Tax=Rhodococcus rhodnii TaxID=38312 RepID=R7WI66_9NOCA|nr:aminotransferase class I/II-fold pyridoxal phosphate-dependent enzyme [Rhodococcus rhodnii]EOM74882.1 transcriptional regulator [Rhodococcus rhodnii LMG 5362]TXG91669.1 aminotransferase class I/II-fold pyridoxal phosphate-dependent enzyme [Rhodococcus rhodnii]
MTTPPPAPRLEITDRTPVGIASAVTRRIHDGALAPGDRLPTVRALASELKVSPVTVSQAWHALAAAGTIVSRGRAGTFVADDALVRRTRPSATSGAPGASRYRRLHPGSEASFALDLSRGTPDPALLPSIDDALRRISGAGLAADYLGDPILPDLDALLRRSLPDAGERIAILDGAVDAVDRTVREYVRFGDTVLVEDPCFPPFLDLLTRAGAEPLAVRCDDRGLLPSGIEAALARARPALVIVQPRAHNPTGASMDDARARAVAGALASSSAPVVEDDHAGSIARGEPVSLAPYLRGRFVHVRSFSKSHGADLRLSALRGPAELIDPVVERRMLGPGWTSRLLQRLLLSMLTDPVAAATVASARDTYASRVACVRDAAARAGLDLPDADGINLWIPVHDESAALVSLAAAGIRAAPGTPFRVDDANPGSTHHVRITVSAVDPEHAPWLGHQLAAAAVAEPIYPRR